MDLTTFLKISRHPYEEPYHVNLIVQASNGEQSGALEIYDNADQLKTIATALQNFPFDPKSFRWELGSEQPEDRFAFYFLIDISLISTHGTEAVVHIRMNNNEETPYRAITEFCFTCEPAGINRLGQLFETFAKLDSTELLWDGTAGEVN